MRHEHPRSHSHSYDFDDLIRARFNRGRGRGGPGGGPFGDGFGPPFGGPPFGKHGRGGRGRVQRGQIRTALLALLEEEPMHGYEMIRRIEERSGGRWKPSPGAVYPTLQQLSDEELVTVAEDGGKRVFSLTDAGRDVAAELDDDDREPWAGGGDDAGFELKAVMRQLVLALRSVAAAGDPQQLERAVAIVSDARRQLYALLAEEPASDAPAGGPDGDDADGDPR